jgi:hypothetical protein
VPPLNSNFLKITFVVLSSLLILSNIIYRYTVFFWNSDSPIRTMVYLIVLVPLFLSIVGTIATGLRILFRMTKREFRFCLARGYCMIAHTKVDEFQKLRYIFLHLTHITNICSDDQRSR